MFEEFYGFKREPFSITPDPDVLYLSDTHREALAHLIFGVESRKGLIVLTGEIGLGKTTMLNALMKRLQTSRKAVTAFLFNTTISTTDFFQLISDELNLHKPNSKAEFLLTLNNFLIVCHAKGDGPVVIIVDEAHNLTKELLEEIRQLLNLETHREKLLQIVLSGQPELWDTLQRPDLRQLKQRIVLRHQMKPLNMKDTEEYIRTRLRFARGNPDLFNTRALRRIYRYSGGIPRVINVICTHALISGYTADRLTIGPDIIKQVARDQELA